MYIMVIEDDLDIRETTQEVLSCLGHQVTTAAHGGMATRMLDSGVRPDLILLDLNMPDMDGRAVLSWLRGRPDLVSIPVIIATAEMNVDDLREHKVLRKPYGLSELSLELGAVKSLAA